MGAGIEHSVCRKQKQFGLMIKRPQRNEGEFACQQAAAIKESSELKIIMGRRKRKRRKRRRREDQQ